MTDEARKAHENKEAVVGERFPEQGVFTEGDVELRVLQDQAEAARNEARQTSGYVAAPMVGDYHAVRRQAKQAGPLLAFGGAENVDDPSATALDAGARDGIGDAMKAAAQARRAAGVSGSGPQGRMSRAEMLRRGTGGPAQGTTEGAGKSASSTGTDTTDRGMDASVGDQPANPQLDGEDPTGQDRPSSQPKPEDSTKPASERGGRGRAAGNKSS